jgi:hypothetical protein
MRIDDRPELGAPEKADFASLAGVSVRRPTPANGKKSDITDRLASMRAAPQYMRADTPVTVDRMRDVTPPPITDIVAFWNDLRASRPMPSRDALRASEVACRWLSLLRCGPSDVLQPDTAFATALRAHRRAEDSAAIEGGVEITAMLSQWILSAARDAALKAAPVRDKSSFDTAGGRIFYELAAVPFGAEDVDHVLCNLDSAGAAT